MFSTSIHPAIIIMHSDREYIELVEKLTAKATDELRAAAGRPELLRQAIQAYLHEGHRLDMSPGELVDFFCVSTPNIVESAGYSGAEGDAIVELFDSIYNQMDIDR